MIYKINCFKVKKTSGEKANCHNISIKYDIKHNISIKVTMNINLKKKGTL